MKHINIPIFIPHLGCPNQCVFCNQRLISGRSGFNEESVAPYIERVLSTAGDAECEIAFFGGSFTGIDRALMTRLLDTAQRYVDGGRVCGIRMSTRPDYIDEEIVDILNRYTFSQVELGIQSTSDAVLKASERGHTAEDTRRAVKILTDHGISVVGQMMTGLPGATPEDEIRTAQDICDMGCSASRIYPTVVFRGTELEKMYKAGKYAPMSVEEAADRSAAALEVFVSRGVPCIRIGLCESDNLHTDDSYSAGPNHPSLGEIVMSRVFLRRIKDSILNDTRGGLNGRILTVECPVGSVSKVIGNNRSNEKILRSEFGIKKLKTIENDKLLGYNIKVLL